MAKADLYKADLREANLRDAKDFTDTQLSEAKYVQGATMPDGQKYERWLKGRGSREDDEDTGPP